jgi:hypothetical protein
MSSALKAFARGMFTFAEIIIVAGVVSSLAAIALLNSLGLWAFPPGRKTRFDKLSNLELAEIAHVLVRSQVACFIVNANHYVIAVLSVARFGIGLPVRHRTYRPSGSDSCGGRRIMRTN